MNDAISAAPLLFDWQPPRPRTLSIIAFIGVSAVLHAICFYLFQIVYTSAVVLLPPPARVSLITSDSEEGRNMLRWVDAEDPALASATQRPFESRQRSLPRVQHIPSYLAEGPKLKHAPPFVIDTHSPGPYPPGPVPTPRAPSPPHLGKIPTRVSFSDELTRVGTSHLPALRFTASNSETPEAVRFRIAVGPRGEIRHCFPLNSSGDTALDEQARQHLALVRFTPNTPPSETTAPPDVWGIVTIAWGNDVTRPAAPALNP